MSQKSQGFRDGCHEQVFRGAPITCWALRTGRESATFCSYNARFASAGSM